MKKIVLLLVVVFAGLAMGAAYSHFFVGDNGFKIDNPVADALRFQSLNEDLVGTFTSNTYTLTSSTGVVKYDFGTVLPAIGGTTITSSAAELNILDNCIATYAELNTVADVTAGTVTASKALVVGTSKQLDTLTVTSLSAPTFNYAIDVNGTDAYKVTLSPAVTAYTAGMLVIFDANTANTGACTLALNGLVGKPLKVQHDRDPNDNYIEAGSLIMAVYDGTNFQIQTPSANATTGQ